MSRFRSSAACVASALLLLASGCATPKWLNFSKPDLMVAGPDNPVVHMLAMWQPASGTGIDNEPARGFAGQIYFFAGKDRLPAQVHGAIRIFEFDDRGNEQDRVKPLHQFDFPDAAWQMYLADTKLGPCYTVFIPYMRKGFHEARCTLRVRLTPDNGPPIFSDMISVVLPGTKDGETPPAPTASAVAPTTAAAAPQQPPVAAAAAAKPAPNAVQQAAAIVAESVNQQPRRLPPQEQQEMVRQMAQYLQSTGSDEEEAEAPPPKRKKKKRPAKPVVAAEEDDGVEYADEEPPVRSRLRSASRRQHPLDEDEAVPVRPSRRRAAPHPLESDDDEAVEEIPRQQPRRSVRVESAQATPVDRVPRKSSGRVERAAARVAEPEYEDDVDVIGAGAEVDDEAPDERVSAGTHKSPADAGWQASAKRRAPRQVIQQASAEVEVVVAPQSDAVNPASSSVRPKMQTFSIPISSQNRSVVSQ